MEQYFVEQTHPTGLMFMVETYLGVNDDGSRNLRLEVLNLRRDELPDLNKTYEFVRMATTALPVLRKV